jgi:hypothetical protein
MAEPGSALLAPSEWLDALRELSLCCADDLPHDTVERLREMNILLLLAPERALPNGVAPLAPARLETLLIADASETAAMAMIGFGAGYLLSRSGNGESLATIALPGVIGENSGRGATPALALIGALALSLSRAPVTEHRAPHRARLDMRPALH